MTTVLNCFEGDEMSKSANLQEVAHEAHAWLV
jgi:hypothetical protein